MVFGVALSALLVPGTRYSAGQLASVLFLVFFVAARGVLAMDGGVGGESMAAGFVLTVAGCLVYASGAVAMSRMRADCEAAGEVPPSGADITAANGSVGLVVVLAYVCAFTLPRWEELVTLVAAESDASLGVMAALHAIYLGWYVVHNSTYWNTVSKCGVVTAQTANAVRTVTVSLASAAMSCRGEAPSQCLDAPGMVCALGTALGGCAYAVATARAKAAKGETKKTK